MVLSLNLFVSHSDCEVVKYFGGLIFWIIWYSVNAMMLKQQGKAQQSTPTKKDDAKGALNALFASRSKTAKPAELVAAKSNHSNAAAKCM